MGTVYIADPRDCAPVTLLLTLALLSTTSISGVQILVCAQY
jgi:hypothetical protein